MVGLLIVPGAVAFAVWSYGGLQRLESGNRVLFSVLRGLAMAYEETGAVLEALSTWRQLKSGLRTGSNGWIEASYHLIACQYEAGNHEVARKLFEILMLQAPQATQGQWADDIAVLKDRVHAAASSNSNGDNEPNEGSAPNEMINPPAGTTTSAPVPQQTD